MATRKKIKVRDRIGDVMTIEEIDNLCDCDDTPELLDPEQIQGAVDNYLTRNPVSPYDDTEIRQDIANLYGNTFVQSKITDTTNLRFTDVKNVTKTITSTSSWQRDTYAEFSNIQVTSGEVITVCVDEKTIGGSSNTQYGSVQFTLSDGTTKAFSILNSYAGDNGRLKRDFTAPSNSVSAKVIIYGVGNYNPQIGDTVIVKNAYVTIGQIGINNNVQSNIRQPLWDAMNSLSNVNGVFVTTDITIVGACSKKALMTVDVKNGIRHKLSATVASGREASFWLYIKDTDGNDIIPSQTVVASNNNFSYEFTPSSDYDNAIIKIDNADNSCIFIENLSLSRYDDYLVKDVENLREDSNEFGIASMFTKKTDFTLYGFKSNVYEVKEVKTWQTGSYVVIDGIDLSSTDILTCGCEKLVQFSKNIGYVQYFGSDGATIRTDQLNQSNVYSSGKIFYRKVKPANAVSAKFSLYGIGNYAAENAPSIGDKSSIILAYAYTGSVTNCNCAVPESWREKEQDIQKTDCNFIFGIQTDSHFYSGISDSIGKNLNEFSKKIPMDFIANLGDIIEGYSTNWFDEHEYMRKSMTEIVSRYTENASCDVLFALGNHDSNYMYAEKTGTNEFSFSELYRRLIKPVQNSSNAVVTGEHYYYSDYPMARVIVLNTCDASTPHGFGISEKQKNWFTNVALNTQKPVLVLSHVPLVQNFDANYHSSYANITNALSAFRSNGGTVIACVCGHTHTQASYTVDGILHISCTQNYTNQDTVEFFCVDTESKTIKTFGFGSAEDRAFSY